VLNPIAINYLFVAKLVRSNTVAYVR
jgi:hypothetical protein